MLFVTLHRKTQHNEVVAKKLKKWRRRNGALLRMGFARPWLGYMSAVVRSTSWVPLDVPRGTQEVGTGTEDARCWLLRVCLVFRGRWARENHKKCTMQARTKYDQPCSSVTCCAGVSV